MIIFRDERISVDVLQLEVSLNRSKLIFSEKAYVKLKQRQNICELKKRYLKHTYYRSKQKNACGESKSLKSTKTLSTFSIVSQHFQCFFLYIYGKRVDHRWIFLMYCFSPNV